MTRENHPGVIPLERGEGENPSCFLGNFSSFRKGFQENGILSKMHSCS
jgi:hypothetical protein